MQGATGAITGRLIEVLGLRWRDVDLERGLLATSQTVVSVNYAVQVPTPKTGAGRRAVALDAGIVDSLRAHRVRQVEERPKVGVTWSVSDDLLFATLDGKPLHPGQFSDRFHRLVNSAGVPRIRLHDLRHTHATLMLTAGVHPKVVQECLGHANITVTLQTYSHVLPAMQEEAAAKFANIVAQGSR